MLVPLAGGGQETLLSEVGFVLLPLFSTRDACALRLVCREFLVAVSEQPWEDRETVIKGSIAAWRACFPHARCANVRELDWDKIAKRATPVVDADFVHFEGLRELYMAECTEVTGAAFVHLRGIQTLDMTCCRQSEITDAAFAHLVGIQRLSIYGCHQLTDAAIAHLRGIKLLNMSACSKLTGAAFVHLRGIHTLYMWDSPQSELTGAAFVHLRGIHTLVIEGNDAEASLSDLSNLEGISVLGMYGCNDDTIFTAQSLGLPVLTEEGRWGISRTGSMRGSKSLRPRVTLGLGPYSCLYRLHTLRASA
jgi:hypothetical protein